MLHLSPWTTHSHELSSLLWYVWSTIVVLTALMKSWSGVLKRAPCLQTRFTSPCTVYSHELSYILMCSVSCGSSYCSKIMNRSYWRCQRGPKLLSLRPGIFFSHLPPAFRHLIQSLIIFNMGGFVSRSPAIFLPSPPLLRIKSMT